MYFELGFYFIDTILKYKNNFEESTSVFASVTADVYYCGIAVLEVSQNFLENIRVRVRFTYRSSHRRRSIEKNVLKNFAKFTGKHLCQSLIFDKVAGIGPVTLLKKRLTQAQEFSCEFCEIFKNTFFTE